MDAGEIEVTIDGAVPARHYVHGQTSTNEWKRTIRSHPAPWGELETKKVIVTLPSSVLRDLDDPSALMDVILCFKLDRLGRSLPHLAQIVSELTAHRVALVCPSQGIDTSTLNPAGQLQLNILMAVAEFERAIIRERVTAGLRAAKANGVKLGRRETLSEHLPAVAELLKQGLSPCPRTMPSSARVVLLCLS